MFEPEPTYTCRQCLDDAGGWILLNCFGHECGRAKHATPHLFAVRCPCWLRRNADVIRKNAEARMQKGQAAGWIFDDLSDLMSNRYRWGNARTVAKDPPVKTRNTEAA